ncbi:hypothetical protein TanjilG_24108 [Lupinus angustifolius]|uniref:Protein kinase domain-containing protein n=2 Tax=Lupinus angustifolius TaxID=3871 RepID=A0A1J7GUV9_LUPAN|nr:hypothetical protein TanjilG_24108 [Lupinus angustifolius]
MDQLLAISEVLAEIDGRVADNFRAISNGFQKYEKIKDSSRQSRLLEELTDKMRDSKRCHEKSFELSVQIILLFAFCVMNGDIVFENSVTYAWKTEEMLIKEFDKEIKAVEGNFDRETSKMLNEKKQSMIKELNSYVALKKQYATNIDNKRIELFEGSTEDYAEKNVLLASSMTNEQLMDRGNHMMDETDQAIERGKKVVQDTVNVGTEASAALKAQTEQMSKIVNELDSIHFSIKKASQLVKDVGRQVATDKCIMALLFLIVVGIVVVIVVKGHKEWLAEVQFLSIVNHPNLVKLLGYCSVDGERGIQLLLVYEFMPNRSLEDHLFNKAFPPLLWKTRLEIMLGAARGLAYLHEDLEIQVIYRDFKSSNVLLDMDFHPKLSDFGLAREGPQGDQTHVSTAVVGTHGYAAPEYIETGHLKVQSDMYSFGVVLYEILTGRRSLERNHPRGEQKLLDWVKQYPADTNRFSMIMDPCLRKQYSPGAARKIAKLADNCLKKIPEDRPSMNQIVETLKQALQYSDSSSSSQNPDDSSRSNVVRKGK